MNDQPNRDLTSPNLAIGRTQRESLLNQTGKIVWFTGLSGSGKSTLANALEIELNKQGKLTFLLDGDVVRQGLNADLGFSDEDRTENIRRIAHTAKLMMDAGLIVICAFISPFQKERDLARQLGGEHFVEIYLSTPLQVCAERDTKGLYKKAGSGELKNLSGMGSHYETPNKPELTLDTSILSINQSIEAILCRI